VIKADALFGNWFSIVRICNGKVRARPVVCKHKLRGLEDSLPLEGFKDSLR